MADVDEPRVWVVQANLKRHPDGTMKPKFDLSEAAKFGLIEFVFEHGTHQLSGKPHRIARDRLDDFMEHDYVLPVGDPCLMAIVWRVLFEFGVKHIQALHWDAGLQRYDVIIIGEDPC